MDGSPPPVNDILLVDSFDFLPFESYLPNELSNYHFPSPSASIEPLDLVDCFLESCEYPQPNSVKGQSNFLQLETEENLREEEQHVVSQDSLIITESQSLNHVNRPSDLATRLKALVDSKIDSKLKTKPLQEDRNIRRPVANENSESRISTIQTPDLQTQYSCREPNFTFYEAQRNSSHYGAYADNSSLAVVNSCKSCEIMAISDPPEAIKRHPLTPSGESSPFISQDPLFSDYVALDCSTSPKPELDMHGSRSSFEKLGETQHISNDFSISDNQTSGNMLVNTWLNSPHGNEQPDFEETRREGSMDSDFLNTFYNEAVRKRARRENSFGFTAPLTKNIQIDTPRNLLLSRLFGFAEAVVTRDEERSKHFLHLVKNAASPTGDSMERVAFYALEALKLRMLGRGQSYPSSLPILSKELILTTKLLKTRLPMIAIVTETSVNLLLDALENEDKIHIIVVNLPPEQWERFVLKLSLRKSGPPKKLTFTIINAIDTQLPNFEYSHQMQRLAKIINNGNDGKGHMCFEWRIVNSKLSELSASTLNLVEGEAVAVHIAMALQRLPDDSVLRSNPRAKFLEMLYDLNPKVVVITDMDYNLNSPFFLSRFKECLNCFSQIFDMIGTGIQDNPKHRMVIEGRLLGEGLVNVISCEGLDMRFRAETLDKWQMRMKKAGFTTLSIEDRILENAKEVLKRFNLPDFSIICDNGGLRFRWKGLPTMFTSAFRQRV